MKLTLDENLSRLLRVLQIIPGFRVDLRVTPNSLSFQRP
jgi:hypothetical protein